MKRSKSAKAPKDLPRTDIIAALHKSGTSLRQLAKLHGCGVSTLSMALRGPAAPSEDLIAGALGLSPAALWPSRFNPDGTRLDLRQQSRCPVCGHVYSRDGSDSVGEKHATKKAKNKAKDKASGDGGGGGNGDGDGS